MFSTSTWSDPTGMSPADAAARFAELERVRRETEAAMVALVGEVQRAGTFAADGHASASGWVKALGRWSAADACQHRQVADLAAHDEAFRDLLAHGGIGWAQAVELGRAFANPRCGSELLADLPDLLSRIDSVAHRELRDRLDVWTTAHDLAGTTEHAHASHERRSASIHVHQGVVRGTFTGSGSAGAAILDVFERFRQREFEADWATCVAEHGLDACGARLPRTDARRRFDALLAVFTAAATPPKGAPPVPLVNLVVDIHTLAEILDDGVNPFDRPLDIWHRRCGTTDGVTLAPGEILTAMWNGRIRTVITDHDVVVAMGRRRRLFTGRARRAVLLRHETCVWPGCEVPASRCQADHLHEHQHGGGTDPPNGAPLCPRHNRFKTAAGFSVHHDRTWHTHRPDHTEVR